MAGGTMQGVKGRPGFTLLELMIVVAIVGILAAVAIPRFVSLVRKTNEGATKGNLGAIRSAVSIYYADMEGQYPGDLSGLTVAGKFMSGLPAAKTPDYHPASSASLDAAAADDSGGWVYDNVPSDSHYGVVWVNCTHTDVKGSEWSTY